MGGVDTDSDFRTCPGRGTTGQVAVLERKGDRDSGQMLEN